VPSLVEESQLDIRPDVVQGGVDVADKVKRLDDHLLVGEMGKKKTYGE
jgi:hypothetical protein